VKSSSPRHFQNTLPVQFATAVGNPKNKKADAAEYDEVFHHVGLLVNEPSSSAGMLFA
jgi:hypothetical protein